jgi:hypothetical protein
MIAGNLRSLCDAGWEVELFKVQRPADPLVPWRCRLRRDRKHAKGLTGVGPGDALARAVDWAKQEERESAS